VHLFTIVTQTGDPKLHSNQCTLHL
jgi:hypothetical protein